MVRVSALPRWMTLPTRQADAPATRRCARVLIFPTWIWKPLNAAEPVRVKSKTILIVDDEKHTRDGLRRSLEDDDDFEVYAAADVAGARPSSKPRASICS